MKIPWEILKDYMVIYYIGDDIMYYIYCYTNKLNNHKYVGQTNNFKRRLREHKSCALNPKSSSYNDLIHQKMRQYGVDNFDVEILEILYTDDINIVNERE